MKIWVSDSKIGIDLDDVLFDFVGGLAVFHNETFGTKFTKEDFHTYHFNEHFGCSQEEISKRVNSFLDSPYFADLKPLDGAVAGVSRLIEQDNKPILITSRHDRLSAATQMQLEKHFPVLADAPRYFSRNAYVGHGGDTKETICRKEGLRYIIEDSPIYAKQCSRCTQVLLMRQPWNQELTPEGRIIEVNGWGDINNLPRRKKL
jgi:hypothetical protein